MIRLSVMYPNTPDARFDHEYYANHHMKMVTEKMTPMGMTKCEIDKGISGGIPGSPPPYVAVMYMLFGSLEELQKAMATHDSDMKADVPNYTNIEPQIQISEVVI